MKEHWKAGLTIDMSRKFTHRKTNQTMQPSSVDWEANLIMLYEHVEYNNCRGFAWRGTSQEFAAQWMDKIEHPQPKDEQEKIAAAFSSGASLEWKAGERKDAEWRDYKAYEPPSFNLETVCGKTIFNLYRIKP